MTDSSAVVGSCAPPTDAEAVDTLEALVRTPSVSGDEARAVGVFVESARRFGLATEIDGAGNGLAVRRCAEPTRVRIALLGHIDTVAGEIPVRIEDGVLHGRGAVDAKGPLAAMLIAAARADVPDWVELTVIAAVGEETAESPGARFVRDRMRPDGCVIGEPSGWDGVTLGYKGRLLARARCERSLSHSAGPEASSADTLHAWWSRVLERAETLCAGREGAFDRVQCTIQSVRTRSDGLNGVCEMEAGFRLPEWLGPDVLASELRLLAVEGIELECRGGEEAVRSDRNDAVVRALTGAVRSEGGRPRQKVKTGTADFNVVAPVWGCPIAAYGPGDSALDHTPEEQIDITEYLRSISVLAAALRTLALELSAETA